MILRRFRRQQQLEQGATLGPWAEADDALVGHGDALADGQPQSCAGPGVAGGANKDISESSQLAVFECLHRQARPIVHAPRFGPRDDCRHRFLCPEPVDSHTPRPPQPNGSGNRAAVKRRWFQNPRDRRLRFTALFYRVLASSHPGESC